MSGYGYTNFGGILQAIECEVSSQISVYSGCAGNHRDNQPLQNENIATTTRLLTTTIEGSIPLDLETLTLSASAIHHVTG